MSETLKEWLDALHENLREEGHRVARPASTTAAVDATMKAVKMAADISGILDAHIYGVCETCGGKRVCPACQGTKVEVRALTSLGTPGYVNNDKKCPKCKGTGDCPDCGKLSVVTAEVRAAAVDAAYDAFMRPDDADVSDLVDAVLSTVLGKVRVVAHILPIKQGKKMWGAGPLPSGRCEVAILEADDKRIRE